MSLFALTDEQARGLAGRGTPCFGYRLDLARERFAALRSVLPDRVRLAYAVKSNPGAPILAALAGLGAWFDCASAGEVAAVRRTSATAVAWTRVGAGERTGAAAVGASPIVLAGPGKSLADLRAGLAAGARVQVDGIEDVARLDALHRGADPLAVSVRVHPASGIAETSAIIGGAGPSAFGVDEEDLPDFLGAATAYPGVRVGGLQVFAASNELDADRLLANHRVALAVGERMATVHGMRLDLIDLGGGLGIPYDAASPELDVASVGAGLEQLLAEHDWFDGDLLLEPGRWLSGPTGVYLTRVVRVKRSRGTAFAVLEGGINHLLRPLLTGQSFPVRLVGAAAGDRCTDAPGRGGAERTTYTLTGPLCTSLDRVGTAELPPLQAGDLLAFGQAGAYAATQAMTHFLSHPAPTEHWLEAPGTRRDPT